MRRREIQGCPPPRLVSLGVFVDERFLDRVDRECLRWGLESAGVIRDAVAACVLGPVGLKRLYGVPQITPPEIKRISCGREEP